MQERKAAAVTIDELRDAKQVMPEKERTRRYRECLDCGGCAATLATAGRGQAYCTHCLTLYRNGYAVDPPPFD